jgi:hypothetical protein
MGFLCLQFLIHKPKMCYRPIEIQINGYTEQNFFFISFLNFFIKIDGASFPLATYF